MKEQFITRNRHDISEIFVVFNELNVTNCGNYVLYYDGKIWEIFDTYHGVSPIVHQSRHVLDLLSDMRKLNRDLALIKFYGWSNRPLDGVKRQSVTVALKHIKAYYPESWQLFIPENYGKREEE